MKQEEHLIETNKKTSPEEDKCNKRTSHRGKNLKEQRRQNQEQGEKYPSKTQNKRKRQCKRKKHLAQNVENTESMKKLVPSLAKPPREEKEEQAKNGEKQSSKMKSFSTEG